MDQGDPGIVRGLWRTIIAIPWIPVRIGSAIAATIQGAIVQSAVLALDEWDSQDFADRNPGADDAEPAWDVCILQRVKGMWDWLAQDGRVVQLFLILFCRLVLGGPSWLYTVAFRLFSLIMMVSRSSLFSAGAWSISELVHYTVGRRLLGLVHLDRLIMFTLPLGANVVPLGGELTPLEQAYYILLPSCLFFGAFTVAARQTFLKQRWADMKSRDLTRQIEPNDAPGDLGDLVSGDEFLSYCQMYETFRMSWHVMALLYSWERDLGLGNLWFSLSVRISMGMIIRLTILNSHLVIIWGVESITPGT